MYNDRISGKHHHTAFTSPAMPSAHGEIASSERILSLHGEIASSERILSLHDLLLIVRKRLWIVALVAVLITGAGLGFSLLQTPLYESSIRILIGQERVGADTPREDVAGLQMLTQTMAEGVDSRSVAEGVIRQLGLDMTPENLLANLRSEQVPRTQFVQVTYRDSSPQRAQEIADAIGDVFSGQVSEMSPSASTITATPWDKAKIPDEPVSPNLVSNGILALALGLILGVGLALLLEYLDDSWRSMEEAEQITGVPTFAIIPEFQSARGEASMPKRGD